MLPVNVLAEDQISDGAGFKLETETYKDGVLTVVGCVKLSEAKGISSLFKSTKSSTFAY